MTINEIGLAGLGVMGENLALNIANKGFSVSVYNRTLEKTRRFAERLTSGETILPTFSIQEFLNSLELPRRILLMVTAGSPVDDIIQQLSPKLSRGDVLIDAGNSYFQDTERRLQELEKDGISYLGIGVSGGEEGALKGPSIMAGGSPDAYKLIEPIMTKISAHVNDSECCAFLGPRGAGHFTKMVHNGIEYAVMQIIAEAYDIQKLALGLSEEEISRVFGKWKRSYLDSYLMEIAEDALARVDSETGVPLVQVILDSAGQKGTGKWTSSSALDLGVPIPTISAAVDSRNLSAYKNERNQASQLIPCTIKNSKNNHEEILKSLHDAVYCSVIVSYSQGMSLLKTASECYSYDISLSEVSRIWRGGCIVRAKLLDQIRIAYDRNPKLENIILDKDFVEILRNREKNWRCLLSETRSLGIPCPAMNASLDYFDAYRRNRLPTALIQALRDNFGSHTYQRVDKPGTFHTDW